LTERQTEKQRVDEWTRWYRVSSPGYQTNALLAVLENDGPKMLQTVLRELGLVSALDLILDMSKRK
jgi:hypothetical protein